MARFKATRSTARKSWQVRGDIPPVRWRSRKARVRPAVIEHVAPAPQAAAGGREPADGRCTSEIWVIIVSWNSRDVIAYFGALDRQSYPTLHNVVVDDGSADTTAQDVHELFRDVLVMPLGRNYGFAPALNPSSRDGLKRAQTTCCC